MKRFFALFLLMVVLFSVNTANAATWTNMAESAKSIFQVDKDTVKYSGDDNNRTVDFWMKVVSKEKADTYSLIHYLVREVDLTYLKKEHNVYSNAGGIIISNDFTANGWAPAAPDSATGFITKKLFVEYKANLAKSAPAAPAVTVDPQEVKKALEDNLIKSKEKDGSRSYYVRARQGAHLFSAETDEFYFNLSYDANNNKSTTLKVSIRLSGTGASMKEAVDVVVDGRSWHLAPPITSDSSGGYGSLNFTMIFNMPDALLQALATTKGPVSVKWKQKIRDWEDKEFIVQDKSLHDIQLMYLGCK